MCKVLLLIALLLNHAQDGVNFSQVSFEKAQVMAKTENKKILIDFYTDWCVPCKELDKYIFQDSIISKYINEHYVSLKINAESDYGKKIVKQLNIQEAYPTVIFLSSDGIEIDRIIGLPSPEEYFKSISDYTEGRNTFGLLLEMDKSGEANLDLKSKIAKKYIVRGLYEKAIEYNTYLVDSKEFNSEGKIYYAMSRCYSFLNNIAKAIEFAEKAIKINPTQQNYKDFLEKLKNK